jgi:hypothetical protein
MMPPTMPVMVSGGSVFVYLQGDSHFSRRGLFLFLLLVSALLLLLQPCLIGRCRRSHIDLRLLLRALMVLLGLPTAPALSISCLRFAGKGFHQVSSAPCFVRFDRPFHAANLGARESRAWSTERQLVLAALPQRRS